MPRPLRKSFPGAKYHVTVRGNGRQRIFLCSGDYLHFLNQLTRALALDEVVLYAYALLPNHFHLLCQTPQGNIESFMHRLNTAYSLYFRYKHDKPGHCFQGRYKAKLVGDNEYFIRLTRYIHLNPIKIKAMKNRSFKEKWQYLLAYPWSSLRGYLFQRFRSDIVNYDPLKLMDRKTDRANRAVYRKYMLSMVAEDDSFIEAALKSSPYAVGNDEFVEKVAAELKSKLSDDERLTDVIPPDNKSVRIKEIEQKVAKEFGVEVEAFHTHGNRAKEAKAVVIEVACRLSGKNHRKVGQHFGVTGSAVGKQRQRLKIKLANRQDLQVRINHLLRECSLNERV